MRYHLARQPNDESQKRLPLYSTLVSAGLPTFADDAIQERLDIGRLLVQHPESTFFVKVEGDSMLDASIQPGDLLVVDRAVQPRHNQIVIAIVEGEYTVKRLSRKPVLRLVSANKAHPTEIHQPFEVWGTVLWVVHKAR